MSIAEKFEKIADAVYEKGIADRDELIWQKITHNGARTNYSRAFNEQDWRGYTFVKSVCPVDYIIQMFYTYYGDTIPNNIDFSKIDTTIPIIQRERVFSYSRLVTIPDLNCPALDSYSSWFSYCRKLVTIELLRVKRETIYTSTFSECSALTNITFEGEIGQSISFKDSPLLSVESQINIIKHLVDFSGTSDAGTRILTIHPTAFERLNATYSTPEEVGIPFFGSWLSYINSIGWDM